ncbi:cysteine desulfurase DndA [Aliivibrio fischeri]|uniref:cysteine desulfurase DndA n=1 Tax=Aliivibrio fischeri TaxID=668 RepID=UPI0013CC6E18|nr:cysteine desulfurase DndA [Aliivibrio fischeri]
MTIYLDNNATTKVALSVADIIQKYLLEEYGNSGSRTHEFGLKAKQAVDLARQQVANVIDVDKNDVIFTSGATESNNIAILGLKEFSEKSKKKHIITTEIEHKAVLEPCQELEKYGFNITYLKTDETGLISKESLSEALREDTVLVSIMHVNNETGSLQDLSGFCDVLKEHDCYFHVDAAQSFGKYNDDLKNSRIDMISASSHKCYGPKGVGALIIRRRGFKKVPLKPLMFGGGQEKGLRPGTLPVAFIAGFGEACRLASIHAKEWAVHCQKLKLEVVKELSKINAIINGENTVPHVVNFSIPSLNSETALVILKGLIAISNGSACTSSSYTPSHVLTSMGLDEERIDNAIRMSWSYETKEIPLAQVIEKIKQFL